MRLLSRSWTYWTWNHWLSAERHQDGCETSLQWPHCGKNGQPPSTAMRGWRNSWRKKENFFAAVLRGLQDQRQPKKEILTYLLMTAADPPCSQGQQCLQKSPALVCQSGHGWCSWGSGGTQPIQESKEWIWWDPFTHGGGEEQDCHVLDYKYRISVTWGRCQPKCVRL